MFGCCNEVKIYKVKGAWLEYGLFGHSPLRIYDRYIYGPFVAIDDRDQVRDCCRRYYSRVDVQTCYAGATKTVESVYPSPLSFPVTTTTYFPDKDTFDFQWSWWGLPTYSSSGDVYRADWDSGVGAMSHVITYSGLIADADVWTALEAMLDGFDWGDVPSHVVGSTFEPGLQVYGLLGATDVWGPITGGWPILNRGWAPVVASYSFWSNVGGYARRMIQQAWADSYNQFAGYFYKNYHIMRLNMSNVGSCMQSSDIDGSGCPTSWESGQQSSSLIDATSPGFSGDPSDWSAGWGDDDTSFRLPATPTSRTAGFAEIPFHGGVASTYSGCAAGRETRYFRVGAQINVLPSYPSDCEVPI